MIKPLVTLFLAGIPACLLAGCTGKSGDPVQLSDLIIRDVDGSTLNISDPKLDAHAFVFVGTECPVSNKLIPTLNNLISKYKRIQFVAVNSNFGESFLDVARHRLEFGLKAQVVKDFGQQLMSRMNVKMTSEVILVSRDSRIIYRGAVDDQYGVGNSKPSVKNAYLRDAIDRYLNDGSVSSYTKPSGCYITEQKKSAAQYTYNSDIRPIVQKNCISCHYPDGTAPFALDSLQKVRAMASMIRLVLREYRMPPWSPHQSKEKYQSNFQMSDRDRQTFLHWLDSDMKEGVATDVGPAIVREDFSIKKPDKVLSMREPVSIPKDGPSIFRHVKLQGLFEQDQWIQEVEFRVTARKLVHHIFMYVMPKSDKVPRPGSMGLDNIFAIYGPGVVKTVFPNGAGKVIPKDSEVILEFHYQPGGVGGEDNTSVALKFAKGDGLRQIHSDAVDGTGLLIPAHAKLYESEKTQVLKKDILLTGLDPHAHYRAVGMDFHIQRPGGQKELILSVPNFNTFLQQFYYFKKPLHLEAGTKMTCRFWYNNSRTNPRNPDPEREVRQGIDSTDEMLTCFYDYMLASDT